MRELSSLETASSHGGAFSLPLCHCWTLTVPRPTLLTAIPLLAIISAAISNRNNAVIYCSCFFVSRLKILSGEFPTG